MVAYSFPLILTILVSMLWPRGYKNTQRISLIAFESCYCFIATGAANDIQRWLLMWSTLIAIQSSMHFASKCTNNKMNFNNKTWKFAAERECVVKCTTRKHWKDRTYVFDLFQFQLLSLMHRNVLCRLPIFTARYWLYLIQNHHITTTTKCNKESILRFNMINRPILNLVLKQLAS